MTASHSFFTQLYETGLFTHLDIYFARFTARFSRNDGHMLPLAAALVSRHQRQGHICLDLASLAGDDLGTAPQSSLKCPVKCPSLKEWLDVLAESRIVGRPGEDRPLVLDDQNRLYLHRYWEYQDSLIQSIRRRIHAASPDVDGALLQEGMNRLFPDAGDGETDWQKAAAFTVLTRWFSVISGGPGTGKTTTVAKILALLTEQAGEGRLKIALTAPTGKAAARLQEAIAEQRSRLDSPVAERLPDEASTIHRLLEVIPDSPFFRRNARNPLSADVVVVDEASMVDMALMSKLVQAIPPSSRLILLGDKDQLASVEAGAVLGDLCDAGHVHSFSEAFCRLSEEMTGQSLDCTPVSPVSHDHPEMCDCIVQLQKSYRFGNESGIGRISRAVNRGDDDESVRQLNSSTSHVEWHPSVQATEMKKRMVPFILEGYQAYLKQLNNPQAAFDAFDSFRILSALRQGPYGVASLNQLAESLLRGRHLISDRRPWYAGRPVMITRNDYQTGLFNGDVGMVLQDPEAKNALRVFFPDKESGFRKLNPLRLPEHETVFAMTVHKSQGSEFDCVMLVLPDRDAPVLTRELFYTGITRAIRSVQIWGNEPVIRKMIRRPTQRTSGLRDALWGMRNHSTRKKIIICQD